MLLQEECDSLFQWEAAVIGADCDMRLLGLVSVIGRPRLNFSVVVFRGDAFDDGTDQAADLVFGRHARPPLRRDDREALV